MKKTTVLCDRCGEVIEDNHHKGMTLSGEFYWDAGLTQIKKTKQWDLCEDCANTFRNKFVSMDDENKNENRLR